MSRLTWNTPGTRFFEAGVDQGVLYIDADPGVPWIGLTSVEETPTGAEAQAYYIDGMKYLNVSTAEEFEATIGAFTYPLEFSQCDGTAQIRMGLFFGQQPRKPFGFTYRTKVGNDIQGVDHAYKIHLVYNALATPAQRSLSSFSDSVEASDFSWELTTKARLVPGFAPTAHVIVDSRYTNAFAMSAIEDILYGSDLNVPRLPTPEELIAIFDTPIEFVVTDSGGGKFFVGGPDDDVVDIGLGKFIIDHENVVSAGVDTYTITS